MFVITFTYSKLNSIMSATLLKWRKLIPKSLISAFKSDRPPAMFLGSGFGKEAVPPLKTGVELANKLRKQLAVRDNAIGLSELLQYYKNSEAGTDRSVRDWLETNLNRSAGRASGPGGGHYLLLGLPTREYLTTNYDVLLETAAAHELPAGSWVTTPSAKQYWYHVDSDPVSKKAYGKMHGSFDGSGTAGIIATTDDYIREYLKPRWRTKIRDLVRKRRIVFIGYSLRDFTTWTSYVSAILQNPTDIWPHTMVGPSTSDHEADFWAKYKIHYVPLKAHQFLIALHDALGTLGEGKNPVWTAAACWGVAPDIAQARFDEEHKRSRYPEPIYTVHQIIESTYGKLR